MRAFEDENLYAFEVANIKWVPENMIRRKPEISKASKMVARYFLKHGLPFQYDITTRMLKRVNVIKMQCDDQRFDLGFKSRKTNFKIAIEAIKEKRVTQIEVREPNEDWIRIPPIHLTFPGPPYVIRDEDEVERLRK